MINRIEEIEKIINDANDIVIIYVKHITCDTNSEFEVGIQNNILNSERDIKLYSLCYREHEIPFPMPYDNRVYVFLPKIQKPVINMDAKNFTNSFDSIIENATSVLKRTSPNEIPSPGEIEVRNNPKKAKKMDEMLKKEDISKFPSTFQMTRNVLKQAWDSTKGVLSGRNFLVDADTADKRYDTCGSCEFLKEKRCTHCGCFMETKVHLESASCPIGKW
jgi:hypothetical protein